MASGCKGLRSDGSYNEQLNKALSMVIGVPDLSFRIAQLVW